MRNRRARGVLAALLLSHAVAGCDAAHDDEPSLRTLVGQVDDALFVALVSDGTDAVLYACDGSSTTVAVAEWLEGAPEGDQLHLSSSTGSDAHATATLDDDGGSGTLLLAGQGLGFVLEPAEGDAGLYFDAVLDGDTKHWGGWIVRNDGSVRGSVINRRTGDISPAGSASPGSTVSLGSLSLEVRRLVVPALE